MPRPYRRAWPDRHARLHRRARRGGPRKHRVREPGRGRRRRYHHHLPARNRACHRRPDHRRLHPAPRPRHRHRACVCDGRPHQRPQGPGDDRDRPTQGGRRGRLHRWDEECHQCAGHAPRAHLCPRLRRADRPPHRGSRPHWRRRDERGRVRLAARPNRRAQDRRDHHAGARHAAHGVDRRALSRRLDHLPRSHSRFCAAPRTRGCMSPLRRRSTIWR